MRYFYIYTVYINIITRENITILDGTADAKRCCLCQDHLCNNVGTVWQCQNL